MSSNVRCLNLLKRQHRFVFRFFEGQESAVLATFVEMAADPRCDFDWYDAAILSFELGRRVEPSTETLVAL